ncbi:hypothetical protein [Lacisediminimonas profundi]|uniref:hypothetical protein n=1 Tax=Lacisediminimonas profundi TaxID=2603856 RepID=UPI00124B89B7|nr:hypothetical protein [Lacisediminimonas profundi]
MWDEGSDYDAGILSVDNGGGFVFASDQADERKLGSMQPGPADMPWWERLLQVGATRAIDSHYKDQEASRLMQAQGYGIQGANGYTYRPGVATSILPTTTGGMQQLLIFALIGFVALKALKA